MSVRPLTVAEVALAVGDDPGRDDSRRLVCPSWTPTGPPFRIPQPSAAEIRREVEPVSQPDFSRLYWDGLGAI